MNISISKKGFDTSFGKRPSPILPDNTLLSIPIPNFAHYSGTLYDGLNKYSSLQYKDLQIPYSIRKTLKNQGLNINYLKNYHDLMFQLFYNSCFYERGQKYDLKGPETMYSHLDPDIYDEIRPRSKNWRPLFGQVDGDQTYLSENGIVEGDLFLFYGWFQHTKIVDGKLKYDGPMCKGKHVIFGYFQIDKIIQKEEDKIESWMLYHPHFDRKLWNKKNNTIYIAREHLNDIKDIPGAGYFKFSEDLVITDLNPELNSNKNRINLTIWKESFIPKDCVIALKQNYFGFKEGYFKAPSRMQELMIINCKKFNQKIIEMIKNNMKLKN